MKKSRFSEAQIIGVLKEHQAGMSAVDPCRKHGICDATFYNWHRKYGGAEVADAKRLMALEDEKAKLKTMLAEQMMDVATLKEMFGKTSEARFEEEGCGLGHEAKESHASAGLRARRDPFAGFRRTSKHSANTELRARVKELASERRRFEYRRLHILVTRESWKVNWKKL